MHHNPQWQGGERVSVHVHFSWTGYDGYNHRPGYVFASDEATDLRLDAAYRDYERRRCGAWRDSASPAPTHSTPAN